MRSRFDEQLEELNTSLIRMGASIEHAIALAAKALSTQDADLARQAISSDDEIDDMEKNIESLCLKLILHQQPIAKDLRLISTALKMITDMERIGDHAADISEILLYMLENPPIRELEIITDMARATIKMVTESIDSYVTKDLDLAQAVIKYDDVVDDQFRAARNELVQRISQNTSYGEQALDFLMIAKYYERIGDHAVNIAEWVIFSLTGQHKDVKII